MKKGILKLGLAAAVLSVALLGCQTIMPVTPDSIQTEQIGLAPGGNAQFATIDFSVFFAHKYSIKTWKVEMILGTVSQKQWSGDATSLPTTLTWDGRSDGGSLAPEGTYYAKLTVTNRISNPTTAQSYTFSLDVAPPNGRVTFNPGQFVPDSEGAVQMMTVSINASSETAAMDSWSLDILDQDGRAFRSFDGTWPDTDIKWDGKSMSGEWVSPAQTYIAQATLRDVFGNSAQVFSTVSVHDLLQPKPVQPEAASRSPAVTPSFGGFSPNGDMFMDSMKLALSYGPRASVASWKVEILDSKQVVQKGFSGDGANLPPSVSWDGKNNAGKPAEEGMYTARLSVDYGSSFSAGSATSTSFVLDTTPPTGSITLSDPLFSPIEGSPTITLSIDASSPVATIDSWKMEIYDPEYHLFRTFDAKWESRSAVWDGKGFKGDLVRSAEDYAVVVKVRDEFGNVGVLRSVVPVDILVEKTATGFRILSSRIFFKPYTADYQDVRPELAAQNMKRLADLAATLKKFPDYKISLVGHAVMVYWNDTARGAVEQRDVLVPLSMARAEAVKEAMVARGLSAAMFTTKGVGASDQLVPDSDIADAWQNRRVAFFIDK